MITQIFFLIILSTATSQQIQYLPKKKRKENPLTFFICGKLNSNEWAHSKVRLSLAAWLEASKVFNSLQSNPKFSLMHEPILDNYNHIIKNKILIRPSKLKWMNTLTIYTVIPSSWLNNNMNCLEHIIEKKKDDILGSVSRY